MCRYFVLFIFFCVNVYANITPTIYNSQNPDGSYGVLQSDGDDNLKVYDEKLFNLLQIEFNETQVNQDEQLSETQGFRSDFNNQSDETQTLLQTLYDNAVVFFQNLHDEIITEWDNLERDSGNVTSETLRTVPALDVSSYVRGRDSSGVAPTENAVRISGINYGNQVTDVRTNGAGEVAVHRQVYKDQGNSTDTPLGSSGVFTGTARAYDGFNQINISINSDQDSIENGIKFQVSHNGTDWRNLRTHTYVANSERTFQENLSHSFFRVVFENDTVAQSKLIIETFLLPSQGNTTQHRVDGFIANDRTLSLVKSIGASADPDGIYRNNVQSGVYSAGSSTTPLDANAEFIGEWLDASIYANLLIFIESSHEYDDTAYTDSFGVTGGILFDISSDCSTVDFSFTVNTLTNPPFHYLKSKPLLRCMRMRYTNGDVAQDDFKLSIIAESVASPEPMTTAGGAFNLSTLVGSQRALMYGQDQSDGQLKRLPMLPLGTIANNSMDSVVTKSVNIAEDDSGIYGRIGRILDSLKVAVTEFTDDVLIQPNNGIWSTQISVSSQNRILIPTAPPSIIETPRRITIDNTSYDTSVYLGNGIVTQLNGFRIYDKPHSMVFGGESPQELYLIAEAGAGSESETVLQADTVDNNVGVGNPTDIFTENGNPANFNNTSDTITISGFDSSVLPVGEEIEGVSLNLVARKNPNQLIETSAFVDVVGQDAGNVTQITSPTVTANVMHFYVVSISRRDEFATVTALNNTMGFESFVLIDDSGTASSESRTTVYYMVDTDNNINDGTITANFSQGADHAVISVTRFSGIDKNNPVNSSVDFGANNSGGSYSGTLADGTDLGQYMIALGFEQGTHTTASNPSGAAERFEDGSTAGNDQVQSIITADLTASGEVNFNGSVGGNSDISYVAFTLNPAETEDPVLRLSHSEGISTFDVTIDNTSYLETKYDITADATFTTALIDGMDITIEVPSIGGANAQVDEFALDIFTATDSVRVTIKIEGDAP